MSLSRSMECGRTIVWSICEMETERLKRKKVTAIALFMSLTLKEIVPDFAGHKGECGKVAVFGGCFLYTGAPYFVGISSLRLVCNHLYYLFNSVLYFFLLTFLFHGSMLGSRPCICFLY